MSHVPRAILRVATVPTRPKPSATGRCWSCGGDLSAPYRIDERPAIPRAYCRCMRCPAKTIVQVEGP